MRNIISFTVLFFFSFVTFSFSQYSYVQKGQKELVGKTRNFYGSEKVKTSCNFHSDYKNEKIQFLGNLFPQLGLAGKGLFYNFDKTGMAHITELDGKLEVFQKGNCIYAVACGNLLVFIESFQKEEIPEKVPKKKDNYEPPVNNGGDSGQTTFVQPLERCSCWREITRKRGGARNGYNGYVLFPPNAVVIQDKWRGPKYESSNDNMCSGRKFAKRSSFTFHPDPTVTEAFRDAYGNLDFR